MTHVISHWLQQKFHPFRDYTLLRHCKMALPFETPILDWIRRKSCRLKGLVKAFASWYLVEIYGMMRFSLTTWSHTKWKLIAMYFIFEWKEIDRKVGSTDVITIYNKCLRELKAKFTQKRFEPKDFGNCASKQGPDIQTPWKIEQQTFACELRENITTKVTYTNY